MAYDAGSPMKASVPDEPALSEAEAKRWRDRAKTAFQIQAPWVAKWQSLAELFRPSQANFYNSDTPLLHAYDGLYTSEPAVMLRDLGLQLHAASMPKNQDWFKLVIRPDHVMENEPVTRWCDDAARTMRNIVYFPESGFVRSMRERFMQRTLYGNAVVKITYTHAYDGVHFEALHLRDCAWEENTVQQVDVMHYKMRKPLRDLADLFGAQNLPKDWRERLEKHGDEKRTVLCCTAPAEKFKGIKRRGPLMKFATVYLTEEVMDEGEDRCGLLAVAFSRLFPYHVSRDVVLPGQVYAESATTDYALIDADVVNRVEKSLLDGIERQVNPPILARDEVGIHPKSFRPGNITFVETENKQELEDTIRELKTGEPRFGMDFKTDVLRRMAVAKMQHLIKPYFPEREMTAREIVERMDLYVREAAPLFEPIESENAILMDMVFDLALPMGAFGPVLPNGGVEGMPEEIQGAQTDYEFETPQSRARQQRDAASFQVLLEDSMAIAGLAEISPEAVDSLQNVDWDMAFRDRRIGSGSPQKWLKLKEDVDAMRAQKQAAIEQQQATEMAMQGADTMAKARPENLNRMEQMADELAGQTVQ